MARTMPRVFAVFEGGGVKGAALAGALEEAMRHVKIEAVGGASAGSMVAVLFAAGYSPAEMHDMMLEVDFKRFAPWKLPRLRSSQFLFDWLRKKISRKVNAPGQIDKVTFSSKLRCPVKIVAANITNRSEYVFSKARTPDIELALAARLSMSIPFFYKSITHDSDHYVDGGIISNFPIWLFDEEKREAEEHTIVLGFDLQEIASKAPIKGVFSFGRAVVQTSLAAQRALFEKYYDHPRTNTIHIPTGNISTTQFGISEDEITDLYLRGKIAAELFFARKMIRAQAPGVRKKDPLTDAKTPEDVVKALAINHLYASAEPADVGTYTEIPHKYYIDLMEACLAPGGLAALTDALARHLSETDIIITDLDVVAGHKRSNPLLVAMVAERLKLRPILVMDEPNPRLGYPFEGILAPGERALLVDDVSSDGTLLCSSVRKLRHHDQKVFDVVTLIDRSEGNAVDSLKDIGCRLYPVCTLDDDKIETLLNQG